MCLFNREGGHSWTKTRLTFFFFPITDRSEKSPIPAKRIQNIIEFLTYEVFKYSCRGLFENHKFLFTLLLALKIDIQGGKVKVLEFQTLIKGKRVEEQMKEEVRDKRASDRIMVLVLPNVRCSPFRYYYIIIIILLLLLLLLLLL